jgi:flagellar basal-body rod protein FlgF
MLVALSPVDAIPEDTVSGNLYVSASAALARLRQLDVVANNLANVDTAGFKRDFATFESVLESSVQDLSGRATPGATGRVFVDTSGVGTDFARGAVQQTGGALDVAIDGAGFFEVQTPEGPRYTRAGSFEVDASGQLVTTAGHPVQGEGGPIAIGDRPVSFTASGELVDDTGDAVGRLKVVRFDDPSKLTKEGTNLFVATPGTAPLAIDDADFLPGTVEVSNVQPVRELAQMVILQRAFDSAMQVLAADDRATGRLLQEIA